MGYRNIGLTDERTMISPLVQCIIECNP